MPDTVADMYQGSVKLSLKSDHEEKGGVGGGGRRGEERDPLSCDFFNHKAGLIEPRSYDRSQDQVMGCVRCLTSHSARPKCSAVGTTCGARVTLEKAATVLVRWRTSCI